jgi:hypothetical protein
MGRLLICRRATYSYVLVGGAVTEMNEAMQSKNNKTSECVEQEIG